MPEQKPQLTAYVASELGAQAEDALRWLRQLPLSLKIATLESSDARDSADLYLLFLTEAVLEKHHRLLLELLGNEAQGSVLSLALEPLNASRALLPAACLFELVPLHGLTANHSCIRLVGAVLQRLDLHLEQSTADGWERGTELLPESLLLRCGDREHRIPQNYSGLFTIGRGQNSQLRIDSNYASRLHGCFRVSEGEFTYRDMSSNGTQLQVGHDERIVHDEEVALQRLGVLRIGGIEIHFSTTAA